MVPEAQKEASRWALMEKIYKLVLFAFNNFEFIWFIIRISAAGSIAGCVVNDAAGAVTEIAKTLPFRDARPCYESKIGSRLGLK